MTAPRVQIVCDSCADLPESLRQTYNLPAVPFAVNFGTDSLRDGIDITANVFYDRLAASPIMPTTSQPTPGDYTDYFRKAIADGREAVYIGLSSGLSGAMQNATIAAQAPEFTDRLHLVDSLGASMGLGLMVLKAADMAREGVSAGEIAKAMESYRSRICHVFTLDTLEYAHRGGRVSAVTAVASKVLDVKPIMDVNMEGKLVSIDRVRGRKRSLIRLFDEIDRLGANLEGQRVGISHANAATEAAEAAERFRSKYGAREVVVGQIGPVVGTHTGPGCIAIFFEGPEGRGE